MDFEDSYLGKKSSKCWLRVNVQERKLRESSQSLKDWLGPHNFIREGDF